MMFVLIIIILVLLLKIFLLHRSMEELSARLKEHLASDTNTLLSVSSGDKYVKKLAAGLNRQLRLLRKERLLYQNGNRAIKDAITDISHDLRTPLTAIFGYLELLKEEKKSENVTRYLSYIENRAGALKQLTEELFRYTVVAAPPQSLQLEPVCLNAVLEESLAAFYAALTQRGIRPKISLPEKRIIKNVNAEALSRVFSNILNNAIKYSDKDLSVTLTDEGGIFFSNTAPGLDEVRTGKLFDRFFSVETAGNSTGLGLAISKELMEQMHGSITARYGDGKLTVCLSFPA